MPSALLSDRATLHLTGADALPFLQNLVTAELSDLAPDEARPAALLSPQGKILFDFLISRVDAGLRIDLAKAAVDALTKRLTMYKLRAQVTILVSDEAVATFWEEETRPQWLADKRFPDKQVYRAYGAAAAQAGHATKEFRALRIGSGVAEAEADFPAADVFPHDVLLDQNGGVSFKKGCFIGQEVVSRMQHRATARRRIMVLRAQSHITEGANVESGAKAIGTVLAACETVAMAIVRIDRLADALSAGQEIVVDGVAVEAEIPAWAGYGLPQPGEPE
ncbi:folate-binding protein YgfZ [Aureimonas fodinaquatilis]|uniref:Folate-binding protein YgfZ n=2 Tax=Aureimonas fodinaquatilis TaxID=2565783 RepID=A0A5B0E1E5_9HYPH|nr:folate-binding protein YgfZ [Aureimonas fodinaquatilis]